MRQSMTGFASGQGQGLGLQWTWDIRGVNGKGLDLRVRVPDWISGLDQAVRTAVSARVKRGNVTVSAKVIGQDVTSGFALNTDAMHRALDALAVVEAEAMQRGLTLTPASPVDILGLRGVLEAGQDDTDPVAAKAALMESFGPVLTAFVAAREGEGRALAEVLHRQVDEIETLVTQAEAEAAARQEDQRVKLEAALQRVVTATDEVDPARIAQELALIAVKSDITEEIDRLRTHVTAARALLATEGPVGRKLDFLMQEFNREANTLCSKSQHATLTQVGLALKTVIDQMREQVQNLE